MADKRDYYEILGISKTATAEEIKRAYRKLAMQHHPDRHGGDDSQFKELSEAYEVLKDDQKRAAYDQFGHAGAQGNPVGGGGAAGGYGGGFAGAEGFDFSDILNQFMGGASPFGGARQSGPPRGRDVEVSVSIDFAEAVFGATKEVSLNLDDACTHCGGDGAEPGTKLKTCPTCNGRGQVTRVSQTILGAIQQTSVCSTCQGRGKIPEKPCTVCHGSGVERRQSTINVNIPAGADNGTTLRLSGKGAAPRGGGTKGDLYIQIRGKSDRRFRRDGRSILSDITVPMVDAALGTEVPIATVDGEVHLKVPAGTQSGKVFKMTGRGIPDLGGRNRGDHLVTVNVETPTKLTSKQRELLEQFSADGGKKSFFRH